MDVPTDAALPVVADKAAMAVIAPAAVAKQTMRKIAIFIYWP